MHKNLRGSFLFFPKVGKSTDFCYCKIDENVKIVLGIIKEIIDSEEEEWMKKILEQISKGMSENYILS